MHGVTPRPDPALRAVALLALAYAGLLLLSLWATRALGDVDQIGIAEAVVTVLVWRSVARPDVYWLPAVLPVLGAVGWAVHAAAGASMLQALGWALAATVQIALAVGLLNRLRGLMQPHASLVMLLAPVAATVLVSAPVAAVFAALGAAPADAHAFGQAMSSWWLGHATGALLVMPTLVAWSIERGEPAFRNGRALAGQFLLAAAALVGVVGAVFYTAFPFIAISGTLLAVAVAGRLLTNTVVCMVALAWLVLLPTFGGLRPDIAAAALLLQGFELGERVLYATLSVLPPLVIAAIARDLRRARSRLAAERERLHAITDNVPALVAYLDNGLRYRFVNRRYEHWWGIAPATVLGRRPDEVLPPEMAEVAMGHLRECLSGKTTTFELQIGKRTISATYVPARDVAGLNGVLVLATDITEHKRLQRQLTEEKQLAQVTLASIGDAVVTVDRELRVTSLNPVAEAMTGRFSDDACGRPVDEIVVLRSVADGSRVPSPLESAVREDRVVGLSTQALLVCADGTEYPIEDSAAPIHAGGALVGAVMVFHDVSEAHAHALRMTHMAQHDALTGLPNRVLLQDRLERALADARGARIGALMFLDLDHFKRINDSLGHAAGDAVLREVARRLQATVRTNDTVSRQGGDEFVLLLPRLGHARDAARVAEKLMHALEDPIAVEGHLLHAAVTIGIALFPADGTDAGDVVRHADVALYQAKALGRGRYCFYDPEMSRRAEKRLHIENELRGAIRAGQFELAFQPKVDGRTGELTSVEALLRWRRGQRLEAPAEFLHIAEDSGLLPEIEAWAIGHACMLAARWQADGLGVIPVSVNVAFALHRPDAFVALVRDALARSGLPADRLVLEIVERQLAFDAESGGEALSALADEGVRIAVDDFGTEYSNLRYLQRFPFHELKIDRVFVESVDDGERGRAVVAAIIAVARALGTHVVAEGVETTGQREALVELGCGELQGFLFAPPLSEPHLRELLAAQAAGRPH